MAKQTMHYRIPLSEQIAASARAEAEAPERFKRLVSNLDAYNDAKDNADLRSAVMDDVVWAHDHSYTVRQIAERTGRSIAGAHSFFKVAAAVNTSVAPPPKKWGQVEVGCDSEPRYPTWHDAITALPLKGLGRYVQAVRDAAADPVPTSKRVYKLLVALTKRINGWEKSGAPKMGVPVGFNAREMLAMWLGGGILDEAYIMLKTPPTTPEGGGEEAEAEE